MAVRTILIVEDNTAPPQLFTLKRDGVVLNLTGCSVSLIIAKGSTITNTGHQTCTVVTPTSGIVQYEAQVGDFSTPGTYKADIKVTYANGTSEVLFDQAKFKVRRRIQ